MESRNTSFKYALIISYVLIISGCSKGDQDKAIKADITIKAKEDVNFAGVQFVVKNGTVTLTGNCPTEKARELVKQKLHTIHVIDRVVDRLNIAPVVLGASFTLKQQIDSVLAEYPTVTSLVSDTSVTLIGSVKRAEMQKLLPALGKVYPAIKMEQLVSEH